MDDFGEKHLELMNTRFSKDAEKYLLTDEEIIQCFGLLVDFACLTNKRLFFVDKKLTKYKNEVVSIPFREIKDVRYEQKLTLGEVKIITRSDDFDIKMDRGTVKMFADAVLAKIL